MKQLWANPQRRFRLIIALGSLAAGASTLESTRGVGITFLAFGTFSFLHLCFDIIIVRAAPGQQAADAPGQQAAAAPGQQERADFAKFAEKNQAAVITASATILGLITAFSGGTLPAAAKIGVIGLGGGVILMFVNQGSRARLASEPMARALGLYADILAFSLFALGLIAIVVSLLTVGGLGKQNNTPGKARSSVVISESSTHAEEAWNLPT